MPFVFIVGGWFTDPNCISYLPLTLRDCNGYQIAPIFFIDILYCVVCGVYIARKINADKYVAFLVALSLFLSLPNLFALERGNYIVVCAMFMIMFMQSSGILNKCLWFALMVNIKQYMVIFLSVYAVNRQYKHLLLCVVSSFMLLIGSACALGDEKWILILDNMIGFTGASEISVFEKLWFPTSINSFVKVVSSEKFIQRHPANQYEILLFMNLILAFVMCAYSFTFAKIFIKKIKFDRDDFLFLTILCLLVLTDTVGGYGIIFTFPFLYIFFDPIRKYKTFCVVALFLLLTPLDFEFIPTRNVIDRSYLISSYIYSSVGVTFLSYAKPFVILILYFIVNIKVNKHES